MLACTQLLGILLLPSNSNLPSLRSAPSTLVPLFHLSHLLMKAFTMFIAHVRTVEREEVQMTVESVALMTYCSPVSDMSQQAFNNFLVIMSSVVPQEIPHHQFKILPRSFLIFFKGVFKLNTTICLRICGPTNTPALIFSRLNLGNLEIKYLNTAPSRSRTFTKFFIRPSFVCRGGRRILLRSTSAT